MTQPPLEKRQVEGEEDSEKRGKERVERGRERGGEKLPWLSILRHPSSLGQIGVANYSWHVVTWVMHQMVGFPITRKFRWCQVNCQSHNKGTT